MTKSVHMEIAALAGLSVITGRSWSPPRSAMAYTVALVLPETIEGMTEQRIRHDPVARELLAELDRRAQRKLWLLD